MITQSAWDLRGVLGRRQVELEGEVWNSLFWKNAQALGGEEDIRFRPYEAIAHTVVAGGPCMGIIYEGKSRQFHLYSDEISYIMTCPPNGQTGQFYYGGRTRHKGGFGYLLEFAHRDMVPCVYEDDTTFSLEHIKQEYPGFGTEGIRCPAYGIGRENRSRVSSFAYKNHVIQRGKPESPGLSTAYVGQDEEVRTLKLYLEDPMIGMELMLFYIVYEKMPMLTHNVRFVCRGPELICLERATSLNPDLPDPRYQMTDLTGARCRERYMNCHGPRRGVQSIHSMRGHSSHQFNPFIYLKWPNAGGDSGKVIGISPVHSGNFLVQARVDIIEAVRVTVGIHPERFDWPLCSGEEFQTPKAVVVYSGNGLNSMSQVFHQLYRIRLAREYWRDRGRPILINNWGAALMDFDGDKILFIMDRARKLGIELFVLDDGRPGKWDDDTTSLEDWYPDLHKLPGGTTELAGGTRGMEMKLGLWFEPEMISRGSRLYHAHPDWMLGNTDRSVCIGRHQYVLDLSKGQVVEYIGDRTEETLGDGSVFYVKWDMSKSISDLFSAGRDAQCQGTMYHRQTLGVYKLYDRLTRGFPHILFESYASDGARFNPGILYCAPQDQASDSTDGMEHMKIQYGAGLVYPFSSMGSHVSAILNHRTQRNIPLAVGTAAACFGTFGYGLGLSLLAEEEQCQVREQIRFTKECRKLIQQGRFYRLIGPFEGGEAAWIVVLEDADKAITTCFRFPQPVDAGLKRLILKGLNPGIIYQVSGVNYTAYGDGLMNAGLILPNGASSVWTSLAPQGGYLSRLSLVEVQP